MTLGSHQTTIGASQVYITPKWILDALGPFDLDPCAADPRPWDCARVNFTHADNGLTRVWQHGHRAFLNPPFDRRYILPWIDKLARHGCGTLLVHARTETEWFGRVWAQATAILFLGRRVIFNRPDGGLSCTKKGKTANSGAPVCLAAFGYDDARHLSTCGLSGALVTNWRQVGSQRIRPGITSGEHPHKQAELVP